MTVNIEKNVEIPEIDNPNFGRKPSPVGTFKYIWLTEMEPGDSVRFNTQTELMRVVNTAKRLKDNGHLPASFQYVTRTVKENGNKFYRFWRQR